MKSIGLLLFLLAVLVGSVAVGQQSFPPDLGSMCRFWDGETKMVNALWIENPPESKFGEGRDSVAVFDVKGPGVITMIHFAMPQGLSLDRGTILRMYWDGEENPSVNCPLVDFFCDPNGALEQVDTALVTKKRGWNAWFVMPFAKSARIEVLCDNKRYGAAWQRNPCYSYVMYRPLEKMPEDAGYFHAEWRQQTLLLGKEDYTVFEATGRGHFIGWNVTVRGAGAPTNGYPVDENEKFFVDGEEKASIEWQGIEDSFGFSWGFPETAATFAYMGWQPYYKVGAAAYRFCLNDRITFKKSLVMRVGFGENEDRMFFDNFSKPENPLQFSSVAYWYQTEPHQPIAPLPAARDRWPVFHCGPVDPAKYRASGETVVINCGKLQQDVEFLEDGWDFAIKSGFQYAGWSTEINHCWADEKTLEFDILCPKGAQGVLKLFILDGDNMLGGRKQSVTVAGRALGEYANFQKGQWIEAPISAADTSEGRISVAMKNLVPQANAVVSCIRFTVAK